MSAGTAGCPGPARRARTTGTGGASTSVRSARESAERSHRAGRRPDGSGAAVSTKATSSSSPVARPTACARSRSSASARPSPAAAASTSRPMWGSGMMPRSTAHRVSRVSETVASRQPVRPHGQATRLSGTGRCATSPAPERGPLCTTPAMDRAASTTLPTNRCSRERRASGRPNSSSDCATARAWFSTRTANSVCLRSSADSGRWCQPSASCRTTVPVSGATQPPIAAPTPRTLAPAGARSAMKRAGARPMWSGRSAVPISWCRSCCRATTVPRRSVSPKSAPGTPMCTPATSGPPAPPVRRSTGICGLPTPLAATSSGTSHTRPSRARSVHCRETAAGLSPDRRAMPLRATGPWSSTARSTDAALASRRPSPEVRAAGERSSTWQAFSVWSFPLRER